MNRWLDLQMIVLFLFGSLLLAACDQIGQEIAVSAVTFDGEGCSYDGPEVIGEGQSFIDLNDLTSDPLVHLHVVRLDEGKTWQDLLDYMGESLPFPGAPPWTREIFSRGAPDDSKAAEYVFEPGLHAILCSRHNGEPPVGNWPGAPFEVMADSSG